METKPLRPPYGRMNVFALLLPSFFFISLALILISFSSRMTNFPSARWMAMDEKHLTEVSEKAEKESPEKAKEMLVKFANHEHQWLELARMSVVTCCRGMFVTAVMVLIGVIIQLYLVLRLRWTYKNAVVAQPPSP